ncbi:MAG: glucose-1-phosphate cytidylyltransferase [Candidatus Altiarchaeota archaeon]|nr:glucose-1-phosphate cytidylyltransferase [Candidatus Altiarchaeota archaeon]
MDKLKTVIFCGGTGTRLREQTEFVPKPLVRVGERPILWHIMKTYGHYGIKDFVLCLGYKGEMIKDYFLNYEWLTQDFTFNLRSRLDWLTHDHHLIEDWTITFADTGLKTLTAGRLAKADKYLKGENTFMATYGDGVADVDIKKLLAFHKKNGKTATITGAHPSSKYGLLQTRDDKSITSFQQKPRLTDYINIGFMVFDKEIFDYLKGDRMIEDVFVDLAKEEEIIMYPHEGFFHAIDTFKDYEDMNAMWERGERPWMFWKDEK